MGNMIFGIYGCLALILTLTGHVTNGVEFSQCYDDANICLWTNGGVSTLVHAIETCWTRNKSFLPRVTDSIIQSKFQQFRDAGQSTINKLIWDVIWIDVRTTDISDVHWIDGLPLAAGGELVPNQMNSNVRYAVITYNVSRQQFVFAARRWDDRQTTSYICQTTGVSCISGGEWWTRSSSQTSTCYLKVEKYSAVTWYSASNDCLSRGGSLAVFSDLGRPSDDLQLTQWINNTQKSYWIGLTRSLFITADEDGRSVDVQYSNWRFGFGTPTQYNNVECCVLRATNHWDTSSCHTFHAVVCQNYTTKRTRTTTTSTKSPSSKTSSTFDKSASTTTTTTSRLDTGALKAAPSKVLEIGLGVGLGVGIPCITATVLCLCLLVYKYKTRSASSTDKPQALETLESRDDDVRSNYTSISPETEEQAEYDVIQADERGRSPMDPRYYNVVEP